MMDASPPRIRFRGICKSYGPVRVLHDVSFDVQPGCVHALVGENGAGKSTLMKILAGATPSDRGVIELDGEVVRIGGARAAQELGVAIVYQEFNLVPHLSVAENVFLGRWPRGVAGLIRRSELEARARALFSELRLDLPIHAPIAALGVAQQQMVEIAKALSLKARVLILDEPSAVLTPHELGALFELVRGLTARGVSVLYISHRLEEVFELSRYVTVLRDGQHVLTRASDSLDRAALIAACVGRTLSEEFPARNSSIGEPVLRVRGLTARGIFQSVSFEVRAGEVFALTGLVGSGRSSVLKAIFGALPAPVGEVQVGERRGPFAAPKRAMEAGIALLPEDRRREGLLLARALRENVTLASRGDAARFGVIRMRRERACAARAVSDLRIRAAGIEALAGTLSGGNQQKLMIARWLQREYRVILFDEPTRGVDVGAKSEIYGMMNALAARGCAVLMVSSELPEVIGMADTVGVMCRGRLAGVLDNRTAKVTQEQILRLAIGEATR